MAAAGSPSNLGGYGPSIGSDLGAGFAIAASPSGASDRHGSKGSGRLGYAARYGNGARDVPIASVRSRRRTSSSSDQTDNGRL